MDHHDSIDPAQDVAPRKRACRLIHLPRELVVHLEQRHASAKGEVMANLGISDNTWRKIRTGMPIRASVADRLRKRLLTERARD